MFQQDYIMRLIQEMVRLVLKLLFGINRDTLSPEIVEDEQSRNLLEELLDMIDDGKINQAENQIYTLTDSGKMNDLEIALLFYSYLNDKDDDFLQENNYTREEIKTGLQDMMSKYGLNNFTDIFE